MESFFLYIYKGMWSIARILTKFHRAMVLSLPIYCRHTKIFGLDFGLGMYSQLLDDREDSHFLRLIMGRSGTFSFMGSRRTSWSLVRPPDGSWIHHERSGHRGESQVEALWLGQHWSCASWTAVLVILSQECGDWWVVRVWGSGDSE